MLKLCVDATFVQLGSLCNSSQYIFMTKYLAAPMILLDIDLGDMAHVDAGDVANVEFPIGVLISDCTVAAKYPCSLLATLTPPAVVDGYLSPRDPSRHACKLRHTEANCGGYATLLRFCERKRSTGIATSGWDCARWPLAEPQVQMRWLRHPDLHWLSRDVGPVCGAVDGHDVVVVVIDHAVDDVLPMLVDVPGLPRVVVLPLPPPPPPPCGFPHSPTSLSTGEMFARQLEIATAELHDEIELLKECKVLWGGTADLRPYI